VRSSYFDQQWMKQIWCACAKQYWMVLGRKTVYHTQSVAHCLWKIHKICCFSAVHSTFLQHFKYFQTNAWWISANTHTKPKVTNTELADHWCRICQIALLQWCEWDIYQMKSRTFEHPKKSSWDNGTFILKMKWMGTIVYLPLLQQHEPNTACVSSSMMWDVCRWTSNMNWNFICTKVIWRSLKG
jgi:hypothetical protein